MRRLFVIALLALCIAPLRAHADSEEVGDCFCYEGQEGKQLACQTAVTSSKCDEAEQNSTRSCLLVTTMQKECKDNFDKLPTTLGTCSCVVGDGGAPQVFGSLPLVSCAITEIKLAAGNKDKKVDCHFSGDTHFHGVQPLVTTPTASSDNSQASTPFKPPTLEVPIPNMTNFSDIPAPTTEGGDIVVPWLGQYVAAGYQYFVGVAAILAIILMMVGGFEWITSAGNSERVSHAKHRINHAVIGFALAVGSYVLLYTINPDLIRFKGLTIPTVKSVAYYEDKIMNDDTAVVDASTTVSPTEPATSETYTKVLSDCPFDMSPPLECSGKECMPNLKRSHVNARVTEFIQKIQPLLAGKSLPDKIKFASEAATNCKLYFSNCGADVYLIYSIAGIRDASINRTVSPTSCLKNFSCNISVDSGNSSPIFHVGKGVLEKFDKIRCTKDPNCTVRNSPGCTDDGDQAKKMAKEAIQAEGKWNDHVLNQLQPGDYLGVYTGNTSCNGGHSEMFLGWKTPGKVAIVANGDKNQPIHIRTADMSKGIIWSIRRPLP